MASEREATTLLQGDNHHGSSTTEAYYLPDNSGLDTFVGDLVDREPPKFIKTEQLEELSGRIHIDPDNLILPEGLSAKDFEGIVTLSLYTECATSQYADEFDKAGRKYRQPWLSGFTRKIWEPDEMQHHLPFKVILMQMGRSEVDIDAEVREIQSVDYLHESGDTPAHLASFGMIQEFMTRNWYTKMRNILEKNSPEAAQIVRLVEVREALHTTWYSRMLAMQIEQNPELIRNMAEGIAHFKMPGNQLGETVSGLQEQAANWLPLIQGDMAKLRTDVMRVTAAALNNDRELVGRFLMEMGYAKIGWLSSAPGEVLKGAVNKLGSPGRGILGEAVLEAAGMNRLFEGEEVRVMSPGWVRAKLRTAVAEKIRRNLDSTFGFDGSHATIELKPSQEVELN